MPLHKPNVRVPTVVVDVLGGEGLVVRGHAEDLHLDVRVDHLALLGALGLGQLLPADDADLQLDRVGERACGSKGKGGCESRPTWCESKLDLAYLQRDGRSGWADAWRGA